MDTQQIIEVIKHHRKILGLSQEKVANKSGVSFRTYQRIESGEISPRMDVFFKILKAIDLPPHQIFQHDPLENSKN